MNELYQPIAALLSRVRTRWRRLVLLRKTTRAALAAASVLLLVLMSSRWVAINPAAEAIFEIGLRGEQYDRRVSKARGLPEGTDQGDAVHPRHHDVRDDQFRLQVARQRERPRAILDRNYPIRGGKEVDDQFSQSPIVFGQ